MFSLISENQKFSFDKSFIILLLLSTLLPSFDAIDNNAIRWFSITVISGMYILKLTLDKNLRGSFSVLTKMFFLFSFSYLLFSLSSTANFNEGLISINKIYSSVCVLLTALIAFRKIKNPIIFLAEIFSIFLLIECSYLIIEFFFFDSTFTGISTNRNISSSSIIIKFIFLIFLMNSSRNDFNKVFLKVLEVMVIISIILLQSRLGLFSLVLIYILFFFINKAKRKYYLISLFIVFLSSILLYGSGGSRVIEKNYNILNIESDESLNQRLNFYEIAFDLFREKPLIGHGVGSWKYESLGYKKSENNTVLIPYYTHNDFLQILVETGIIGLGIFSLIILYLLNCMFKLLKRDKDISVFTILFIFFFLNSMINFPLHRSQEFVPFILCCSLIMSKVEMEDKLNGSKPIIMFILGLLIIPSSVLNYKEHKSLIIQDLLLLDYSNNTYTLNTKNLDLIDYKYPNLAANTVPISSYLSRYYFQEENYIKSLELLEYAEKANKHDLITKELLLRNYLFLDYKEPAFYSVKELIYLYPNNQTYGQLYFSLISDLKKWDELLDNPIIYFSDNYLIHKMFLQTIEKHNSIDFNLKTELKRYSTEKFADLEN